MPAAVAPPPMRCASSTGDPHAERGQFRRARRADDAGADTITRVQRLMPVRMPHANGSRSSNSSVPSAVTCAGPVMRRDHLIAVARIAIARLEHAADDALLPPHLASAQLAVGGEAGELRARAGAARRAVVGLAGAQHEVAAVGAGRASRAEQFDVVDQRAVRAGDALRDQRVADRRAEVGQRLDVARRVQRAARGRRRGRTSCRPRRCRRSTRRSPARRPCTAARWR